MNVLKSAWRASCLFYCSIDTIEPVLDILESTGKDLRWAFEVRKRFTLIPRNPIFRIQLFRTFYKLFRKDFVK